MQELGVEWLSCGVVVLAMLVPVRSRFRWQIGLAGFLAVLAVALIGSAGFLLAPAALGALI